MKKANAKLLIFDFDGTLSDSREMIVEGINRTFEMHGFERKPVEVITANVGLPIEDIFENLESKFEKTKANVDVLVANFRTIYYEDLQFKTKLFPGTKEMLQRLKMQGKTLAIASSKKHKPLMEMLKHYGIENLFDFVVGADDVPGKKPDPHMINKILKEGCFSKDETLMIGDAYFDIEMGHNAGIKSCALTYGIGSKETIMRAKPEYVVNSVKELAELLG